MGTPSPATDETHDEIQNVSAKYCSPTSTRSSHCRLSSFRHAVQFSLAILWLGIGIIVLCLQENLDFINASYVLAQMITTVGYGDLVVQSSVFTMLFLSCYSLLSCVIFGGIILSAIDTTMRSAQESIGLRMRKLQRFALAEASMCEAPSVKMHSMTPLMSSFTLCLLALLSGTLFFAIYEDCACAHSLHDGCDPDNCEATGGHTKTFVEAWYMSCISLTTIGFGDYTPKSVGGRLFAIFWVAPGVVLVGNFVVQFSSSFLEADRESSRLQIDVDCMFSKIDQNANGSLDRHEFLVFTLLEHGIVTLEDMDEINGQFDSFDRNHDDKVTREEVYSKYAAVWQHDAAKAQSHIIRRIKALSGLSREPVKLLKAVESRLACHKSPLVAEDSGGRSHFAASSEHTESAEIEESDAF